jgi:hypothetical protein
MVGVACCISSFYGLAIRKERSKRETRNEKGCQINADEGGI